MGVFSYLKDLLGKEPEPSKENVYVVDPEFEETKAKGGTSQSSSDDSTAAESEEYSEDDSVKDHSQPRESASTDPEGLIKGEGTLAHLLEKEKGRPESSAAPRVGEEELAHSFAAEDLAEDPEDGFEVPESEVAESNLPESEVPCRDESTSGEDYAEDSFELVPAKQVEGSTKGVNDSPRDVSGEEGVVDVDSNKGVVLRIEDDSDGSAEGEVVVPEGAESPGVKSEGVGDELDLVDGRVDAPADEAVESERVSDPVVGLADEAGESGDVGPGEGEDSSSEGVEVEVPVVKSEDETVESDRIDDPVVKSEDETQESEGVEVEVPVVKSEDETQDSERVDDLVIKPVGEIDSGPVVAQDSGDASEAEDGMDLVSESDEPGAETPDEGAPSTLLPGSGEQADGLDHAESVDLDAVAPENENFESSEAEDTHSPAVENANEPGAQEDVSGDELSGGVVSGGEDSLGVKSKGQTLGLDVGDADDSVVEPSGGVSVADGPYASMSVVPWSVYMARQSEEAADAVGEDQDNAAAGEDLAVADQSGVRDLASTVEPENDADSVDEGDEQLIVPDEEYENDADSVDEGDDQLIAADEEPVEATVAPGLSLDEENGVEDQDRGDVSFVADSGEDAVSEAVDEDSDDSVSEPSDLLDEDEGGEFVEAEYSDESGGDSSSVVKSELEVDPSLIGGSDESETKKGESDGGLHISIPGF